MVVVGGPQSGKSTLLRSIVTSLALTHTPREAQAYCLDFGGGALNSIRDLPHVGGVATRLDVNDVRRTIAEMRTLLLDRERLFAQHGVDGMATYRRAKRAGQFADDPFGDVFLFIDGWLTLRNEFEDLEAVITDLANRGLSYGIHVVVACSRWMDLRPAIRDLFGTRLELRLGDPSDSYLDRKSAMNVPESRPGRGITPEKLQMLTALPRVDGRQSSEDLAEGVAKLVQDVRNAWTEPGAPPVRLLPALVPLESLPVLGRQPAADRHRRGRPAARARRLLRRPALPALRRRRVGQDRLPALARQEHHHRSSSRTRRGSSWSTTGAACSARSARTTSSATARPPRSPRGSSPRSRT